MVEPIGAERHERLRRLPWTSPDGKTEYVTQGDGLINQIADSTEAHIISMAREDAADALVMVERPETRRAELATILRKLASAVNDVAHVAELRGERLDNPAPDLAARALTAALRKSLPGWGHE
ncbi:hypothetical protein ACFY2Z_26530 [Streptomyces sp. NPDC001222]|uniref:hypothetical protein n=1 Tax=Streptomyces sp. NPDC001222 TaxID=3364548 RepID=UPI0036B9BCE3